MKSICFDWGNTLMLDLPQFDGPMKDWPQVECVPGVAESLEQLSQEYKLYVATNASESTAEDVHKALERVGIAKYITKVFTRNELKAKKPYLKFFYQLIKKVGDPGLIFIGDDYQNDILGAVNAGLITIWYNPVFAAAPAHMPVHDAEFSHFSKLIEVLENPILPSMQTCQFWMMEQPASHGLQMHCRTVSAIAYQLSLWCNENGTSVDPILVQRAAFLHDLGKLIQVDESIHHGEIASKILTKKGFPQLASIVEKHPLLCLKSEIQNPSTIAEKLVYLADKYVEGCRIIPLEERIAQLAVRYPKEEGQIREIKLELLQLQNECCDWMGFTPNEILYQIQQALK
ncbi:MAG: HAD-IA family hydrolase [Anaerolineaceae bacterium]|nr:HAD-IA family hydrolase [Anaerolineaceae bacterium]